MNTTQQEIHDLLCNMTGEQVTHLFTTFLGAQVLTDDFAKFLIDEDLATEGDFSVLFEYEEEEDTEILTIDTVKEMMESSYTLVYLERCNNLENSTEVLTECLKSKSADPLHEHINDWFSDCESDAINTIVEGLKSECEDLGYSDDEIEEFFDDNEDKIREEIYSRDDSDILQTLLRNSDDMPIRVEMHSNYDCINSHYFEGSYSYKESYFGNMVDALCLNPATVKETFENNDIKCIGEFPNLSERNGNELVSYEHFATEISNSVAPANLLTFMAKVSVSELYENGFDIETITISKGNFCGLYSHSQGGGSLMSMEMQRDLSIKIADGKYDFYEVELDADTDRGYAIKDVYGVLDTAFGDSIKIAKKETEETE